jgi:segregation and condensation protein B
MSDTPTSDETQVEPKTPPEAELAARVAAEPAARAAAERDAAAEAEPEAAAEAEPEAAAEAEPTRPRRKRKTAQAHVQAETSAPDADQAAAAALDVTEAETTAESIAAATRAEALAGAAEALAGAAEVDAVLTDGAETDGGEADGGGAEPSEPPERLKSIVESLIFASDKPLSVRKLLELTGERDSGMIQACIEFLRADYGDRGVVLHEVAGGVQFRTNPLNAHWVQQLVAGKPVRLSRAQLETLAIVAYRQPITRPEIDEIRGVDSGGTLKVLLDRHLVRILGKKEEPGRPMLYGTTKDFLEFFNLKDLKEMPTLREFYELNEDSLAKIKELDERRASDGMPPPTLDGPPPASETLGAAPSAAESDASS